MSDAYVTEELLPLIQAALEADAPLQDLLQNAHPAEIADVLESLPSAARAKLWEAVSASQEGEILAYAEGDVRNEILQRMEPHDLAAATRHLDLDDTVDILQELSGSVADEVLQAMDAQYRARLSTILSYPGDTAGGLMNTDVLTVRADVSLEVVLRYLRLHKKLPEKTDMLLVVDRDNRYLGGLTLSTLLTSDPLAQVAQVMDTAVEGIPAHTSDREVAALFEQLDWISAPVVNPDGVLLGRITVDDVVDVIREEADHMVMGRAGLDEYDDMFAPIVATARRRALWLGINLATAFLAAWVIGLFEQALDRIVALAVLMPVVASMGGIAGTQTLTVMVRGIALGKVVSSNTAWLVRKELVAGLLNGVLWAIVVGGVAILWFGDFKLGGVITAAIVINQLAAAFSGAFIPLVLRRLSIDPALAGGVILTTVTDVIGFFCFLGLATVFLL